ncbi:MAG TPA: hypothetical protein VNE59_11670 [Burkholderiales bacterium]|nr:hypothetical protein [Burkholderiales bacterium]
MTILIPLATLTVPLGGQRIELQEIDFGGGGMRLLRVRIREGNRFTVFDVDAQSARAWAEAMLAWSTAAADGAPAGGGARPANGDQP